MRGEREQTRGERKRGKARMRRWVACMHDKSFQEREPTLPSAFLHSQGSSYRGRETEVTVVVVVVAVG